MTLADRIVVMRGGRIEQIGTPREVYHEPVSRFVAGFIGADFNDAVLPVEVCLISSGQCISPREMTPFFA